MLKKYMTKSEEVIKNFFVEKGFFVVKIKESDQTSPDFLVKDNQNTYLVEFKLRDNEKGFEQKRREILKTGEIFDVEKNTGRNNAISKMIKIGKNQLDCKKMHEIDFKIIWYHAVGRFSNIYFHQIKATLYGSKDIVVLGENCSTLPCLYFSFSDFYRYRNSLDAAIITYTNKAQFCLNSYSPNYEKIKSSKLYRIFNGGIYDPIVEELNRKVYIADCDEDREKKIEILLYIQKKYCKNQMLDIDMNFISGEIAIKKA